MSPAQPESKTAARRRLNRAAVIAAAAAIADSEGLEAVTLVRLAEILEVKPPSLYNHIESLAALHREIALASLIALAEVLTQAAVGRSGDEALGAVAHAYRDFAAAHPGSYSATQNAVAADDPELAAAARRSVDVILAVLAGYGFEGEEALHRTRALRSALHGFVSLERIGGFGMPLDRNHSFEYLIRMIQAGLDATAAGQNSRHRAS